MYLKFLWPNTSNLSNWLQGREPNWQIFSTSSFDSSNHWNSENKWYPIIAKQESDVRMSKSFYPSHQMFLCMSTNEVYLNPSFLRFESENLEIAKKDIRIFRIHHLRQAQSPNGFFLAWCRQWSRHPPILLTKSPNESNLNGLCLDVKSSTSRDLHFQEFPSKCIQLYAFAFNPLPMPKTTMTR